MGTAPSVPALSLGHAHLNPACPEQAVGQGLPAPQDLIPKIWTVVMCTLSPLRDTPEFKSGYEKAELNSVKSKNCCTHWDLLDGGYALGLLFPGLWWPLDVQKLRGAASSSPSAEAPYQHPTSKVRKTCMQELGVLWVILSPEEMTRIKSLQSNLCNSSCIWNTEQKRFLPHLSWRHMAGDSPKRKMINLPLWKKAHSIQSSQESSTNLVCWKSRI